MRSPWVDRKALPAPDLAVHAQEQAEWLDQQQRGLEVPSIQPMAAGESPLLSFAQKRLWFLSQLEGQSATYNMSAALRLSGQLDETALERALTDLIQRHDSLRTCFPEDDGKAVVRLNDAYNPLSFTNLGDLPEAKRQRQATEWIAKHAREPFDLNAEIKSDITFLELLKQVRRTALEAFSRQDIPFDHLVEELNPARNLSFSPLFQTMFVLQNTPTEEFELDGLKTSFLATEQTTAKFDLSLSIVEEGDTFICDWEYNTGLFRPDTMERMVEHFRILLEGILSAPEQSLAQLPLLRSADREQLSAWNQTQTDYPKNQTFVDLFQTQVAKTPEAIALVFEDTTVTYREVNTKANQYA